MSAQDSLKALRSIDDQGNYQDWRTSAIIAAAQLQHADQERIAKALEALLEPLCDIANSITRYEGRR